MRDPANDTAKQVYYWRGRVLEETEAALACDDPLVAAIHVELATHCLRMAQQAESQRATPSAPTP